MFRTALFRRLSAARNARFSSAIRSTAAPADAHSHSALHDWVLSIPEEVGHRDLTMSEIVNFRLHSLKTGKKRRPGEPLPFEWEELKGWRAGGLDERRGWARVRPSSSVPSPGAHLAPRPEDLPPTLAACALLALETPDPLLKCEITHAAYRKALFGAASERDRGASSPSSSSPLLRLPLGAASPPARPGRPARPVLVSPREIPPQKSSGLNPSAYVLHNVAHIELNAVDLALDTVVRFSRLGLPPAFYLDFMRVADEESRHFGWCYQRLTELGAAYGDMPAHDLLLQGAAAAEDDLAGRLSVVNLIQEARGLDAG
jgi:hypothetical protein